MYDDICKFIAEKFSKDLATWLLGEPVEFTLLEPTELQIAPIRADTLILLESKYLILHIEFQTTPKDDVPFRMADYRLRLHRRFPNKQIHQVVIYLRKTKSHLVWQTSFELPELIHRYNVIRLWEVPTEQLLTSSGLLPFAVLSQTDNPVEVLQQVAQEIEGISDRAEKSDIMATAAILAGLVLDRMVINRLLREEIMKESVIYQDIQARGEARGEARGIAIGRQEGRQEGEIFLILRLLKRRFGEISPDLTSQIQQLSVEKLENLAEALLDFQELTDLVNWLNQDN